MAMGKRCGHELGNTGSSSASLQSALLMVLVDENFACSPIVILELEE